MKLSALLSTITGLLGQITGAKNSLPDQNSLEKGSPQAAQFQNLSANCDSLETLAKQLKEAGEGLVAHEEQLAKGEFTDEQLAAAKAKLIESGEVLSKADHDLELDTKVKAKEQEMLQQQEDEKKLREQAENNRAKVEEKLGKLLGAKSAEVLARLPADALATENIDANAAKLETRFKKISDLGITVDSVFQEAASIKLDEEGDKQFDRVFASWESLCKGGGGGGGGGKREFGTEDDDDTSVAVM